jgi:hypothetical protein
LSLDSSSESTPLLAKFSDAAPLDFSLLLYLFSRSDPKHTDLSILLLSMVSYRDELSDEL